MRKKEWTHDHLQCIQQQLGQQFAKTLIKKPQISSSSQMLLDGKNYIDPLNNQLCTKYNKCMDGYPNQRSNEIEDSSFQVPSQILCEQQYKNIEISPFTPTFKTKYETQLIVNNNLLKKKKQRLHQINLKKHEQQQRLNKLQNLKSISKKKLQKCPKKPISQQKRPGWNHSIFGQNKQTDSKDRNNSQQRNEQANQKTMKQRSKVELEPVKDRITKYIQKQRNKKQQIKQSQACRHQHTASQKNLQQKKLLIEQSSKQILEKMKEQKRKQEQNRKIIKAKIRALQIQSRASLKKFKKKPVDPNVEFIVQVPTTNQGKNKKSSKNQKKQAQNVQKNHKNRKSNLSQTHRSQNAKNKNENKKKTDRRQQKENESRHENTELKEQQSNEKFYFWQIPIYKDDIAKIDIGFQQQEQIAKRKEKRSTFREEVDSFLSSKNHSKMQQYNRMEKQKKFAELVSTKKERFLQEYSEQSNGNGNFDQIFWNEEELYKLENIKIFN